MIRLIGIGGRECECCAMHETKQKVHAKNPCIVHSHTEELFFIFSLVMKFGIIWRCRCGYLLVSRSSYESWLCCYRRRIIIRVLPPFFLAARVVLCLEKWKYGLSVSKRGLGAVSDWPRYRGRRKDHHVQKWRNRKHSTPDHNETADKSYPKKPAKL